MGPRHAPRKRAQGTDQRAGRVAEGDQILAISGQPVPSLTRLECVKALKGDICNSS